MINRSLVFVLLLLPATANSQIVNCEGKWINRPCASTPKSILTESPLRTPNPDRKAMDAKNDLVHSLSTLAYKAKQDHKISVDISHELLACAKSSTSVNECAEMLHKRETVINELIMKAEALEVEKERNKIESEKKPLSVTVVNPVEIHIIKTPRPLKSRVPEEQLVLPVTPKPQGGLKRR